MDSNSIKDLATLQIRNELIEQKLFQADHEVQKWKEEARVSKRQLELIESELADLRISAKHLRDRIVQLESEGEVFNSLKNRNEVAVSGLTQVAREAQDRVAHLEARLRMLTEEKEALKQSELNEKSFIKSVYINLGRFVGLPSKDNPDKSDFDLLTRKLVDRFEAGIKRELHQEHLEAEVRRLNEIHAAKVAKTSGLGESRAQQFYEKQELGQVLGTDTRQSIRRSSGEAVIPSINIIEPEKLPSDQGLIACPVRFKPRECGQKCCHNSERSWLH